MISISQVDHLGIRIKDLDTSVTFYEQLGFKFINDYGFETGHPVVLKHDCGIYINLLGPSTDGDGSNILMDVEEKYAGYTHVALRVKEIEKAVEDIKAAGIEITFGPVKFTSDTASFFVRDPDRNVIEFTEHGRTDLSFD